MWNVGADCDVLRSSDCPCALGQKKNRDLDKVVHGDDFAIAGFEEDLDWVTQMLSNKLELVWKARLGADHDDEVIVLSRCVTYIDARLTREADPRHAGLVYTCGRAWTSSGAPTDESRWSEAKPPDHDEVEPDRQKSSPQCHSKVGLLGRATGPTADSLARKTQPDGFSKGDAAGWAKT